jgi:cytidine deaminase
VSAVRGCRQQLAEFASATRAFTCVGPTVSTATLGERMPMAFGPNTLNRPT